MSNLLKSFSVVCDNSEKRIIDNNAQISQMISALNDKSTGGFVQGLTNISNVENDTDFVENGIESDAADDGAAYEEIHKAADEMLATAMSDAEAIIEKASGEAETIMEQAKNRGYEDGLMQGRMSAEEELNVRIKELEDEKKRLEQDYLRAKSELEPKLANAILDVVLDVTHILAEGKKDMILQIINGVMSENMISGNFLIRVSKEDAEFLKDNKDKITGVSERNINIEIVTDELMKRNECMIETDFGVFDCSLDMQLENLAEDIRLLSRAAGND